MHGVTGVLTPIRQNPKRTLTPESIVFPVLTFVRIAPSQRVAPTGVILL